MATSVSTLLEHLLTISDDSLRSTPICTTKRSIAVYIPVCDVTVKLSDPPSDAYPCSLNKS